MSNKLKIEHDENTNEYIITIRLPRTKPRSNPYDEYVETNTDSYPTITGLIDDNNSGLCMTIDMEYKGKCDQYTSPFIDTDMIGINKEELLKLCEDNNIPYCME